MNTNKSILLIYAHPDDETVFTGGTIRKYSSSGIDVYLLCATSGENGKTSGICSQNQLAMIREQELENVSKLLGIKEVIYLRYPDKQLNNINKDEIIKKISEVILKIRPNTIITFGPDGATGHADHKAMSEYAVKAIDLACNEVAVKPNDASFVPQVFYVSLTREIREEWSVTKNTIEPNIRINIKEYSNIKLEAIKHHKTQKDSLNKFINVKEDILKLFLEQETFLLADKYRRKENLCSQELLID